MKVLIAAGGTGGHLFPALALARELKSRGVDVLVAGRTSPALANEFAEAGITFRELAVVRMPRKKTSLPLLPFRACRALNSALVCLRGFRPDAVVGMGGYACAAPAAAAVIRRTRLYFCEQNLLPGKVTRAFSRFSSAVFTSFPDSSKYLRSREAPNLGNPLRPFPEKTARDRARRELGLEAEKSTVLVLGGSQGAHRINQKIIESLNYLSANEVQFVHLTGTDDLAWTTEGYKRKGFGSCARDFYSEMGLLYSAADLVVCRAGATTIAELCLFGLPSVLVPFPFAAEDHQRLNADYLAGCGAAVVREEKNLTGRGLAGEIKSLISNRDRLKEMAAAAGRLARPDAAARIADFIISGGHSSEKTSA